MRWLVGWLQRHPARSRTSGLERPRASEAGRRALVTLIARADRAPRDEFTVVFDGARLSGGTPTPGRIRVVFLAPAADGRR